MLRRDNVEEGHKSGERPMCSWERRRVLVENRSYVAEIIARAVDLASFISSNPAMAAYTMLQSASTYSHPLSISQCEELRARPGKRNDASKDKL